MRGDLVKRSVARLGWRLVVVSAGCLAVAGLSRPLAAGDQGSAARARHWHRSDNVSLYTDLSAAEAAGLLDRLEKTLREASEYWRRPLRGMVQCYVVQNLDVWHDRELPHPMARILIGRLGGATVRHPNDNGACGHRSILVFASALPGVAEHEVVHAYCSQTFGTTGPLWYREGMAQLMTCSADMTYGTQFPPDTRASLAAEEKHTLADVVNSGRDVQQLCDSLDAKAARHDGLVGLVPDSQWSAADVQSLADMKRTYARSWVACHLLEHNPNYRARFRALGQDYLTRQEDAFARRFGPVARELAFEYEFTLAHIAPGYRVDLCAWQWGKRFRPLTGGRPIRTRVDAARGYQASGLLVSAGQAYAYKASGEWVADAEVGATTADGHVRGPGRLEAVVMRDYQLSEPIALGEGGSFAAPCDGQLYLRCRDDWSRLSDNSGSIVVEFSKAY